MGYQKALRKIMKTVSFVKEQIEDHRKSIDYDNPRDFIDSYIIQQKKHSDSDVNYFTGTYALYLLHKTCIYYIIYVFIT